MAFVPTDCPRPQCFMERQGILAFDNANERIMWFDGPDCVPQGMEWVFEPTTPDVRKFFVPIADRELVCSRLAEQHGVKVEVFSS